MIDDAETRRNEGSPELPEGTSLPALCDADLFARFLDGEKAPFTVLYHRYAARLNGYIRSLVGGNNLAADDVFQETFLRLYRERRRDGAEPVTNVGGWLFRVARNLSLNQLRSERYLTDLPEDYGTDLVTTTDEAFANVFGPTIDDEEMVRRVHAVVETLPPTLREVFVLREVNGMSYEETADIAECSMEAARMRLSRARAAIRTALAGVREEDEE